MSVEPGAGSIAAEKKARKPFLTRSKKKALDNKPQSLGEQVKEILLIIFYALLIAFVLKSFVVRGFFIPSGSMENTLEVNDRVFVNRAGAMFGQAERGDIIVFEDKKEWIPDTGASQGAIRNALAFIGVLPDASENYLVKRVIGVGGDRVQCCSADGKVTVNGVAIDETYVKEGVNPSDVPFDVIVPENSYFVMGDNRSNSADSRYHIESNTAFINDSDVVGEVFVVAWPLSSFTLMNGDSEVFEPVSAGS
ncbi:MULTISPECIES: signal peptidase I [unclassified Rothia (in: high G+C Gram-positive bacteria)]|uniref:signal peptidase I n=1 Tax=unclassified Rothia (in: high G+C Gram-positive bacteria) TaxID=2689056 RepID=UPI00195AB486|nr:MULTISPECIES: signal peptidase I [unclassified Rothia (in: high G+C Gram-positive bacteria)]MBM7050906.1 signal peptidase I [Rothia sp. ZJ1223]QRZ62355.1 signal peptidase I [Rothia sp. ZJ932]